MQYRIKKKKDTCRSLILFISVGDLLLVKVLDGLSLELERVGDEAGVGQPDLRDKLELGGDLESLET